MSAVVPMPVSAPHLCATGVSERGARNPENEDAYLSLPAQGVFAVCDGMGGHAGGRIASQLVMGCIRQELGRATWDADGGKRLIDLIDYANRVVHVHAQSYLALRGMGCTLVLAFIAGESMTLYHVGDSRAYRLRDYRLQQLTEDHAPVAGRAGRGVTRALGVKATVEIEQHRWDWCAQDRLLLLSDGISDVVPDYRLTNVLVDGHAESSACVASLVAAAESAGGDDDKTALLVQVEQGP